MRLALRKKSKQIALEVEHPTHLDSPNLIYNPLTRIMIGAHSRVGSADIHAGSTMGRYCTIGRNSAIGVPRHTGSQVTTSAKLHTHDPLSTAMTIIHNDVWIGQGAVVMAGVNIGSGAIIEANAVITSDVAPYQIVGTKKRPRFSEDTIEALLDARWWEKDFAELQKLDTEDIDKFIQGARNIKKIAPYKRPIVKHYESQRLSNKLWSCHSAL